MNQPDVIYVDQQANFDRAIESLRTATWIGFDTEFVGEKTYIPNLCLLQIVSDNHIYLVDTIKVKQLDAFLDIVKDPAVLKITHAGDNDYRLLYTLYGVVPQSTFDTQIAAGFVGYNYPAGFSRIVERELRITLAKSHTVADWEARPIDPKAIKYAVEDVKYLPELHEKLMERLRKRNREAWAREENRKWEREAFYIVDPNKEVMSNDYIFQLNFREQIFLARLYRWRREKALTLNLPRETVLQSRHVSTIVKVIKDGPNAGRSNRTLPEGVWRKFQPEWQKLWETPATQEETQWLQNLPKPAPENPKHEWNMEFFYHMVKRQCMIHEISAALLLPRGDFNRLKAGSADFDDTILEGWRAELLGPQLTHWLRTQDNLTVSWLDDGSCAFKMIS